jgi:hypothetical protein
MGGLRCQEIQTEPRPYTAERIQKSVYKLSDVYGGTTPFEAASKNYFYSIRMGDLVDSINLFCV